VRRLVWLSLPVLAASACFAGGPPPQHIDFDDDFSSGGLSPSRWDDVREFEVSGGMLVREAGTATVLSRADLEHASIGKANTPRDVKFTAEGVDLKDAETNFRMVTLRVQRGGSEVIYGSVQGYRDENGAPVVRYVIRTVGGNSDQKMMTDHQGDLVLTVKGDQAQLQFGTGPAATITVSSADPNPVSILRVEIQTDLALGESPSVDAVRAKTDESAW
jgi:hypothetical protein